MNLNFLNKKILLLNSLSVAIVFIYGCVSQDLRLPNSAGEVFKNQDIQQSLQLAAQNNILFSLPTETLMDVEKTEIDPRCRHFEAPFWSEKLSVYLNQFRSHPEWFSRFHALEIKKGDAATVQIQKDLDGASVLSIHYVLTETRGKVSFKTQLPCEGSLATYFGKDIIKTNFEFPSNEDLQKVLNQSPEKANVDRFKFSNDFLTYLAERGAIFKFNFDQSFEKNTKGEFVLAQVLNKISQEIKNQNLSYVNLWLKKINQNSKQAELIQLFGLASDKDLKAGVRVDTQGEFARKSLGQPDLTYLFMTYNVIGDDVQVTPIEDFNACLQSKISFLSSRTISSVEEKENYLAPGFVCLGK